MMQCELQHVASRQDEVKTVPWRPIPCHGGQGNHFRLQVSCLKEEFGVWPREDEPDAEPVYGTSKQFLLQKWFNGENELGKCEMGRKRKDEGRIVPSALAGFDQRRCSWWTHSKWSLRRQKAALSKPSPLTPALNKQTRLVTQPLS